MIRLEDFLLAALLLLTLLLGAEGDIGAALGVRQQRLASLADGLAVSADDQTATQLLVNLCASKD